MGRQDRRTAASTGLRVYRAFECVLLFVVLPLLAAFGGHVSPRVLLPLMWASGIGADVMKPIAAPLIRGLVSSTLMVLFVIPVLFYWVRTRQLRYMVRGLNDD